MSVEPEQTPIRPRFAWMKSSAGLVLGAFVGLIAPLTVWALFPSVDSTAAGIAVTVLLWVLSALLGFSDGPGLQAASKIATVAAALSGVLTAGDTVLPLISAILSPLVPVLWIAVGVLVVFCGVGSCITWFASKRLTTVRVHVCDPRQECTRH